LCGRIKEEREKKEELVPEQSGKNSNFLRGGGKNGELSDTIQRGGEGAGPYRTYTPCKKAWDGKGKEQFLGDESAGRPAVGGK